MRSFLALILSIWTALAAPAAETIDVRQCGAVGDGRTDEVQRVSAQAESDPFLSY